MNRILLIEDDAIVATVILYYLKQAGNYKVEWVKTAGEALAAARMPFDLMLLDICLPDVDGVELCARLRRTIYCPILFISCLDDEETVVKALETGGDDYLTKPFTCKMLQTRIEANLRRVRLERQNKRAAEMEYPDFRIDQDEHTVIRQEKIYHLAPIEFSILMYLIANPNRTIAVDEIYENVWGKPSFGDVRTVIAHIYNLRRIIENDKNNPRYIRSVRGYGYYFSPDGAAM